MAISTRPHIQLGDPRIAYSAIMSHIHDKQSTTPGTKPAMPKPTTDLIYLTKAPNPLKLVESKAIDIVAVHGLSDNASSTWEANTGTSWLRDFIKEDIRDARVFAFNYDAREIFLNLTHGLESASRSLLRKLMVARGQVPSTRPLVFVCHGLGGLLVELSLNIARIKESKYPGLFESVKAVTFLGTPQRESPNVPWSTVVMHSARDSMFPYIQLDERSQRKLFNGLEGHTEFLRRISRDFVEYSSNLNILSYYEDLPTLPRQKCTLNKHCAALGCGNEMVTPMLGCDYHSMAKFSSRGDEDYKFIIQEFKKVIEVASKSPNALPTVITQTLPSNDYIEPLFADFPKSFQNSEVLPLFMGNDSKTRSKTPGTNERTIRRRGVSLGSEELEKSLASGTPSRTPERAAAHTSHLDLPQSLRIPKRPVSEDYSTLKPPAVVAARSSLELTPSTSLFEQYKAACHEPQAPQKPELPDTDLPILLQSAQISKGLRPSRREGRRALSTSERGMPRPASPKRARAVSAVPYANLDRESEHPRRRSFDCGSPTSGPVNREPLIPRENVVHRASISQSNSVIDLHIPEQPAQQPLAVQKTRSTSTIPCTKESAPKVSPTSVTRSIPAILSVNATPRPKSVGAIPISITPSKPPTHNIPSNIAAQRVSPTPKETPQQEPGYHHKTLKPKHPNPSLRSGSHTSWSTAQYTPYLYSTGQPMPEHAKPETTPIITYSLSRNHEEPAYSVYNRPRSDSAYQAYQYSQTQSDIQTVYPSYKKPNVGKTETGTKIAAGVIVGGAIGSVSAVTLVNANQSEISSVSDSAISIKTPDSGFGEGYMDSRSPRVKDVDEMSDSSGYSESIYSRDEGETVVRNDSGESTDEVNIIYSYYRHN